MTTRKGQLRKKLLRFGISCLVIAVLLVVMIQIPVFKTAKYEIRDNQLFVTERTNKYNTNMDVVLTVIDEKGNVVEETVKIYFTEGETSFTYDQEYFKNILETEDDVYITDVENELLNLFSNIENPVKTIYIIYFIITMLACVYFMINMLNLIG